MKKALLICSLCLLGIAGASAKGKSPLSVKSGSLSVLRETATAIVEIDYSETKIGDMPLAEYLKEEGGRLERDWQTINESVIAIYEYILRKNKGLKVVKYVTGVPYRMVVHVNSFTKGSGAAALTNAVLWKSGGMTMNGTVEIVDAATGEVVLAIDIDGLKGESGVNMRSRLLGMHVELAKQIRKLAKG